VAALSQTNAYLLQVSTADTPADSFIELGSGESIEGSSKWSGQAGVFVAPIGKRRESGTDGRDVVSTRTVFAPNLCSWQIGDQLLLNYQGDEVTWSVSGIREIAAGIEASPHYELTIEEK
jgi:hypothetical protein